MPPLPFRLRCPHGRSTPGRARTLGVRDAPWHAKVIAATADGPAWCDGLTEAGAVDTGLGPHGRRHGVGSQWPIVRGRPDARTARSETFPLGDLVLKREPPCGGRTWPGRGAG